MPTTAMKWAIAGIVAAGLGVPVSAAIGVSEVQACFAGQSACAADPCSGAESVLRALRCTARLAHLTVRDEAARLGVGTQRPVGPIRNAAELAEAFRTATPGQTLRLAPGRYDRVMLANRRFGTGGLTITSADPANPATMTGMTLRTAEGVTLRNLAFDASAPGERYGLLVNGTKHVALDRLRFVDRRGVQAAQVAVMLRNSQDLSMTRSDFYGFHNGVSLLDVERVRVEYNVFEAMLSDGIRGGGVSHTLIRGNACHGFTPVPKAHPDCIQLWTKRQTTPASHITIRDNLVVRGNGGPVQGVFITSADAKMLHSIDIAGNLIVGGMYNGISVAYAGNVQVRENEVIGYPDQKSWIRVDRTQGAKMSGNRASDYIIRDNEGLAREGDRTVATRQRQAGERIAAWIAARSDDAELTARLKPIGQIGGKSETAARP